MKFQLRLGRHIVFGSLIVSSICTAQETATDERESWLPARCVPLETIGLHDEAEEAGEPEEKFEPARFERRPFTIRANETFSELLGETEQASLFVTMTIDELNEVFEFTCKEVMGANREPGFSCLNTPPSDILLINPKSMRYSRSAIGTWTFQSDADLVRGSSLFVELGQCYSLESAPDSN